MNKLVLLKILVMTMALFMVLYAMRDLRQSSGMMKANSNNPIFLLFGGASK